MVRSRVYPRVCGGTSLALWSFGSPQGLSPRVRGNRQERAARVDDPGSIPACAGEPIEIRTRSIARWVYPRVCGGTARAAPRRARSAGLSPRVRGNHVHAQRRRRGLRSIPACAGEPSRSLPRRSRTRVYPRVCGGTERVGDAPDSDMGLSPRVRGNPKTRYGVTG